jgi:hypothetical protein
MAVFHTRFYKLFQWKEEFAKITPRNQRIFYTIHIALLLLFLVFALLSFIYTDELSKAEGLALGITSGYSLFWLWRAIWQIVYFRPSTSTTADPRIRKSLFLHHLLTIIFLLLFIAYLIPVISKII